ncbi:hypothetical protein JZK55_02000 [Dissulfurispira thermophila]|uniref:Uncharacterized protein n=2 Tax=root TaxID=1 RepID=A0A7G1GYK1_9BACT|nr:hypothetical protein JZK55_02000 [Dissulfurispira thermophila]
MTISGQKKFFINQGVVMRQKRRSSKIDFFEESEIGFSKKSLSEFILKSIGYKFRASNG